MKKLKFDKKAGGALNKGFYIALAVSIVGAGTAAWMSVNNAFSDIAKSPSESGVISSPLTEEAGKPESGVPTASSDSSSSAQKQESSPAVQSEQPSSSKESVYTEAPVSLLFILPVSGDIANDWSNHELVENTTLNDWRTHDGIDIKASVATPVKAVTDGVVLDIYEDPLFGKSIAVDHGNGMVAYYQNLNDLVSVTKGQKIVLGQVLGSIGETAIAEVTQETHLHFAIKKDGKFEDPLAAIGKRN